MPTYTAAAETEEGQQVIVLRDAERDAHAAIVPEIGNNLFRFVVGGRPVIQSPEQTRDFKKDPSVAFRYGIPILFPPNRIKNGTFTFRGRTYRLPLNEPENHLHGEISSKAWEVKDYGASEKDGAYATCRFRYADHPEIMAYFPHALLFEVTYRLYKGALTMESTILNEGKDEAPFAYGLHPYFPIFAEDGEEVRLQVPAAREWPVTSEAFVTGLPEATSFSIRAAEGVDLREYPVLGCNMLELQDGDRTCRIAMKSRGYTIAYRIDPGFPFVLAFRPPWASAFSLEPYTYVTDAFNLPYDRALTGAKGIGPGEEFRFVNRLWIED
jgi:aldose 1-epimerase